MVRIPKQTQYLIAEIVLLVVAVAAGAWIIALTINPDRSMRYVMMAGALFTGSLLVLIRLWLDPDRIRATQSDAMLNLASQTLEATSEGLNVQSAQRVCDLLLPATSAIAVAITNTEVILGYSGKDKDLNPTNAPIRTVATHATLEDGQMRVIRSAEDIGFPIDRHSIDAAIIVPLKESGETIGTLKFYYPTARQLTETQQSVASGFGELLSTQIAASALEEQKKLATSMELKALQSQINPHFLFNTINTIASFIRTEPEKARVLLREFATFYRRTLEDSSDRILLSREIDQTARYLGFEIARFGEDRLELATDVPDDLADRLVPAFMVQPLVENAVKHGMPSRGTLHITVGARREGDDLVLWVADDGVGMSEEKRLNIMDAKSQTGLGVAVRNIHDRITGFYGQESYMQVESQEGQGTTVTLYLKDGCLVAPQQESSKPERRIFTHTLHAGREA